MFSVMSRKVAEQPEGHRAAGRSLSSWKVAEQRGGKQESQHQRYRGPHDSFPLPNNKIPLEPTFIPNVAVWWKTNDVFPSAAAPA